MHKKKILFVMESLRIGGAEKSLLTLLSLIDYNKYDIELFLFNHEGEFMSLIPEEVTLLQEDKKYRIFRKSRKMAPLNYLLRGDFIRCFYGAKYLLGCLKQRITKKPLYIGWRNVTHLFEQRELYADISIAYLERKCIYFNIDHVKSDKKIGFIHNDYSTYSYDYDLDNYYFRKYDKIATVSVHCKLVLQQIFPEYSDRFVVIKNMVFSKMIQSMAKEKLDDTVKNRNCPIIVTVGRLVKQKGFDYAVEVCRRIINSGLDIIWYVIGEGPEHERLQEQIKRLGLEDKFILVGAQKNPYKWMQLADVYVQPSRFEGFGITIAEAMALNKPIVCSDIPEFREQLGDRDNCYCNNIEIMTKNVILQIKNRYVYETRNDNNNETLKKFYMMLGE